MMIKVWHLANEDGTGEWHLFSGINELTWAETLRPYPVDEDIDLTKWAGHGYERLWLQFEDKIFTPSEVAAPWERFYLARWFRWFDHEDKSTLLITNATTYLLNDQGDTVEAFY